VKSQIRSTQQPDLADLAEIDNLDVVNATITSKPFSQGERMSWFRKFV
jgi:hypothetical protein